MIRPLHSESAQKSALGAALDDTSLVWGRWLMYRQEGSLIHVKKRFQNPRVARLACCLIVAPLGRTIARDELDSDRGGAGRARTWQSAEVLLDAPLVQILRQSPTVIFPKVCPVCLRPADVVLVT